MFSFYCFQGAKLQKKSHTNTLLTQKPDMFYNIPGTVSMGRTLSVRHAALMGLTVRQPSTGENMSLPTPHRGQVQSSGSSSKGVPGAMPLSGSPTAGSYS